MGGRPTFRFSSSSVAFRAINSSTKRIKLLSSPITAATTTTLPHTPSPLHNVYEAKTSNDAGKAGRPAERKDADQAEGGRDDGGSISSGVIAIKF